jgi:indole-3-acetate monooxygenase
MVDAGGGEQLGLDPHQRIMHEITDRRAELEAAGATAEALRTLPPESVQILRQLGVFWLKVPRELGGEPVDPLQFCDVIEELAYCDASAAWAAMIGAGSTGMAAGWLPDEGAEEVFLGGPQPPIFASQPRPRGLAREVDGGYVVNGRWSFASGIHHADWLLGAFRLAGDHESLGTAFVVPKSQARVIDNWNVAGLQGTGSCDFVVEDVFVPATHTYDRVKATPLRGGALFQQDLQVFVGNEVPPFCVGMTRRAVDDMVELASGTTRGISDVELRHRQVFQKELGMAEIRLRATGLLYRDAVGEAWEMARRGDQITLRAKLAVACAQTYAAETCADVILDLFRYGGGRVLSLSHPLQRHLRNALAARQHVATTEEHYERAGRERLETRAFEREARQ